MAKLWSWDQGDGYIWGGEKGHKGGFRGVGNILFLKLGDDYVGIQFVIIQQWFYYFFIFLYVGSTSKNIFDKEREVTGIFCRLWK